MAPQRVLHITYHRVYPVERRKSRLPPHKRFAAQYADIAGCTVHEILGDGRYAIASPVIEKVLAGEPQSYDWQPFPGIWQNIRYIPKFITDEQVDGYYMLGTDITT